MEELRKEIQLVRESQIRMEADIAQHIKRTELLEDMTKPMYKAFIGMKWSVSAIVVISGITLTIARLKGLF